MHIKIGNIQIFSYHDIATHDDIYLLYVGESKIKEYSIPNETKDWQKKRDEILGDCIKTLFENDKADPNWRF